jgi:hypothetical protein
MTQTEARSRYEAYIAAIDVSVAGRSEYGDLRWHVECSAETNASDTAPLNTIEWYETAFETARMAHEDWRNWYPELRS